MAEKNFRMRRKLADGNFDDYFPETKAANVKMADGATVEAKVTAHLADDATETVKGHVQLSSSTTSTSTTLAATPSAVKTAMDKANAAIPSSQKGVANGVPELGANGKVVPSQANTAFLATDRGIPTGFLRNIPTNPSSVKYNTSDNTFTYYHYNSQDYYRTHGYPDGAEITDVNGGFDSGQFSRVFDVLGSYVYYYAKSSGNLLKSIKRDSSAQETILYSWDYATTGALVGVLALDATNFLLISATGVWKIGASTSGALLVRMAHSFSIADISLSVDKAYMYMLVRVTSYKFAVKKYRVSDMVLLDSVDLNPVIMFDAIGMMVTPDGVVIMGNPIINGSYNTQRLLVLGNI